MDDSIFLEYVSGSGEKRLLFIFGEYLFGNSVNADVAIMNNAILAMMLG